MTSKENVGTTEYKVENFRSKGNPFSVSFDMRYLKEALQPFTDEIILLLNESLNRILVVSKSRPNNRQLVSLQRND